MYIIDEFFEEKKNLAVGASFPGLVFRVFLAELDSGLLLMNLKTWSDLLIYIGT